MSLLPYQPTEAGPEIILANEDHEARQVGQLPSPPYDYATFPWSGVGFCCESTSPSAFVTEERGHMSARSILNDLEVDYGVGLGISSDVRILIPKEYLPLERATIVLWRFIDQLEPHTDLSGGGFTTVTLVDDLDLGLFWTSDLDVVIKTDAGVAQIIHGFEPNTWVKWRLEFDFVHRTIDVSMSDDPIGTYVFAPGRIDNPWAFILGSAIGSPANGEILPISGRNRHFDDRVFASIVPRCHASDGDCNQNHKADRCDVDPELGGTSHDCNSNDVPDECETASNDCDTNGIPDGCQPDRDGDTRIDDCDNCISIGNPTQTDFDNDGRGDLCDDDMDNDGVGNSDDVCDFTPLGATVRPDGGLLADLDGDCDVDLEDYRILELEFTGPTRD